MRLCAQVLRKLLVKSLMMRILFIDTELTWRGGENQMRLLIEGLLKQNIEVSAIFNPNSEACRRLSPTIKVFQVSMRNGLDFLAAGRIAKICSEHKIDIIHSQTSHAHGIGILVKKLCPNLKFVVHRRVDYPLKPNLLNQFKYKTKAIDHYVAISEAITHILKEYGIPNNKISTVPSAIDSSPYRNIDRKLERQKWCQRYSIPPTKIILGNASALTDQKGYEVLLQALYLAKKEGLDNFQCLIAGIGHLKDKLHRLRDELELSENVIFVGWTDEIPSFLSALDVFTFPSIYEGLGTIVLEAIQAGCCVVASNAGGIGEMIQHQKTGLLSEVGDAIGFSRELAKACASHDLRRSLNQNARAYCGSKFSLAEMIKGNIAVYQKLMS
jgi:glycosyltransferase involved in cell wall biosynthesis